MNCFESQHFNQVEVSNAGADPGGGGAPVARPPLKLEKI
jgi:hypothetical protein